MKKSKQHWNDISSEEYRQYEFSDYIVYLQSPLKLSISKNGHRVLTTDGISHYIPTGWRHLTWKAKKGMPKFVL